MSPLRAENQVTQAGPVIIEATHFTVGATVSARATAADKARGAESVLSSVAGVRSQLLILT